MSAKRQELLDEAGCMEHIVAASPVTYIIVWWQETDGTDSKMHGVS